jgi:heat shock protein HslJ
LLLWGCEQNSQIGDPLNGTRWILRSLYGRHPLESTIITLEFSKGYVRGNSGCNDYFSGNKYQVSEGGRLVLPHFAMTIVGCFPEEIMDQEEAYTKALDSVAQYQLMKGQLELHDKTGDTILIFTNRNLATLPYLVGAILSGGVVICFLWFLRKNQFTKEPVSRQKAG